MNLQATICRKDIRMEPEKNGLEKQMDRDDISLDPLKDGISSLALVRVSGSDVDVVNAARVSYGKQIKAVSERDKGLINFLMDHAHTSPFEHNQLSFRVKAPIFVARQWMRHRMNSYNEISYRYVEAPLEFYVPPFWRHQDTKNKQASVGSYTDDEATQLYKTSLQAAIDSYEKLLARGVCRELARAVLPVSTYTQYIFTCNLHALMHFLQLRLHAGAQYEIRQYAHGMLEMALPHFPLSLGAWKKKYGNALQFDTDLFTKDFAIALEQ
jgi:thymidylate synthase (FAD)